MAARKKPNNQSARSQICTLCYMIVMCVWYAFRGFLVIYWSILCACWMNEWIENVSAKEAKEKREEKRIWHHQSGAGFHFKSIIINVFVFAHIHFISDILYIYIFCWFVAIASQKYVLHECADGGENGGLRSPHWASITVNRNEANISRVFFYGECQTHIESASLLHFFFISFVNAH